MIRESGMQVTKIEEVSKNRSKVYLEQEPAFVLYRGELRLYHVKEGQELAGEDYNTIMTQVLPRRAKLRAMNLLIRREYTTAQLRVKLRQGLYPEAVIDTALEYVASYHYTDDARYALDYIICHEESRSRRRIEQDLLKKGISEDSLKIAWQKWEEQGGVQNEEQMIRKILCKRCFDFATTDFKEQQKQAAFLMRKGFKPECIRKVLWNCAENEI